VLTTIIFAKNTARMWELRFRSLHLPTQLLLNFGNYYGTYEGTRALQEQGHSEELEMGVLKRGRGVRATCAQRLTLAPKLTCKQFRAKISSLL